jgi:large subunit ribosomal protein L24
MSSTARNRLFKIAKNLSNTNKPSPQLREAEKKTRWDIVRGDKVQVIGNHPEKGKQGIVLQVLRKNDRVLVEGVNMGKKNLKGDKDRGIAGRTIMKERTIHYSKVNLVDPLLGVPTRVTRQFLDDGSKVRVAKKSGAIVPRPEILTFRKRPVNSIVTESCTSDKDAWNITYAGFDASVAPSTNA